MADLVASSAHIILSRFPPIDRPCPHTAPIWDPKPCVLSSSFYGKPCKIQVRRYNSRFQKSRQADTTRLSTAICALDRDLREVLELASDDELSELSDILYGQSILSPLLKSITYNDSPQDAIVQMGDREELMERLESRFLFLAADAKATLSGRRPSYRQVLLQVRKKLNVPCSTKLSTEDMEAEIFLHLLQEYSSKPREQLRFSWNSTTSPINSIGNQHQEPGRWRGYILAAAKLGAEELLAVILAGGSAMTISKLQRMVAKKLSGKVVLEAAKYQVAKEMMKKGGQAVATKLEMQVALLAAEQGFAGAASRYIALRSMTMFLGPLLWGTFLADIVIRAAGTDYARVVQAIYAFAQIRLMRTHGWTSSKPQLGDHVAET